jgi:hypothetical protein
MMMMMMMMMMLMVTSYSKVFLEMLIVAQLAKKFCSFMEPET